MSEGHMSEGLVSIINESPVGEPAVSQPDPVPELLKQYDLFISYARKLSGNYETARDLVQDAFVKLIERKDVLTQENLKSWMCFSIHNAFISECRHGKAGRKYENAAKGLLQIDEESITVPDFERNEIPAAITNAVEALPEHYKDIFKLCADGFTYEQIAEKQQIPIGTVMSRMYRLRTELQSRLPQYNKAI